MNGAIIIVLSQHRCLLVANGQVATNVHFWILMRCLVVLVPDWLFASRCHTLRVWQLDKDSLRFLTGTTHFWLNLCLSELFEFKMCPVINVDSFWCVEICNVKALGYKRPQLIVLRTGSAQLNRANCRRKLAFKRQFTGWDSLSIACKYRYVYNVYKIRIVKKQQDIDLTFD